MRMLPALIAVAALFAGVQLFPRRQQRKCGQRSEADEQLQAGRQWRRSGLRRAAWRRGFRWPVLVDGRLELPPSAAWHRAREILARPGTTARSPSVSMASIRSSPSASPMVTVTNPTRRPCRCCRWLPTDSLGTTYSAAARAPDFAAACRRTASPKARNIFAETLSDLTQYSGCH